MLCGSGSLSSNFRWIHSVCAYTTIFRFFFIILTVIILCSLILYVVCMFAAVDASMHDQFRIWAFRMFRMDAPPYDVSDRAHTHAHSSNRSRVENFLRILRKKISLMCAVFTQHHGDDRPPTLTQQIAPLSLLRPPCGAASLVFFFCSSRLLYIYISVCIHTCVCLYPLAAAPGAAAAAAAVLCMNVCKGKCCGKLLTTIVWSQLAVNAVQVETSFNFLSHPGWNGVTRETLPKTYIYRNRPHQKLTEKARAKKISRRSRRRTFAIYTSKFVCVCFFFVLFCF